MPTYAYRCTACEHRFEQFQRMADDPLSECPNCGGLIKRVIHPVGIVFKGSGWYVTDNRKSAAGENGTADKAKDEGGKPSETAKGATTEAAKPAESASKAVAAD